MACVLFWQSKNDITEHILSHVDSIGLGEFLSKNELALGRRLRDTGFPVDKLIENFWSYSRNQPQIKFMIETASRSWKIDKVAKTKAFVEKYIIELCGSAVKHYGRK